MSKMDYEELAIKHMNRLNRMHEIPELFDIESYKHNAVLCSLYMSLIDRSEKNNDQL